MPDATEQTRKVESPPNNCLGTLLMEAGVIAESDVQRILACAQEKGIRFGEAAIKLGLASHSEVRYALARQFQYPYLRPGEGGFGKELIAAYDPFTQRVEALRALRMQLMFRWFGHGNQTLAIVSSAAREGRSYLTANLAVVFSQLGDRTLIIDANLQSSRMHEIFHIDSSPGLSPALVGRTEGELSIRKIEQFENLWVLPAGAPPPNPEELLARNEFEDVLRQVSSQFDIILVDTPPGDSGVGAETVAYRCGGALLVARRNRTPLAEVRDFSDRLKGRAELVGSVLNSF